MIKGDITTFSHILVTQDSVTLTNSNLAVSIIKPDYSVSTDITAYVNPDTDATKIHTLRTSPVSLDQAGIWSLTYAIGLGQEVSQLQFTHFVFWSNIKTQVCRLLKINDSAITDSDLNLATSMCITNELQLSEFGTFLSSYRLIDVNERLIFDQALSLVVAAWMRPFTTKQGAMGELIGLTIGPDEYKWAPTSRLQDTQSIEDKWSDMALNLLSALPSFSGAFGWQNAAIGFVTSGRRQNIEKNRLDCDVITRFHK